MKLPRYVKCMSLPDQNGVIFPEWAVRIYDNQMEDQSGNKIPTPT